MDRRDSANELLRELPAVHELAAELDAPHALAVAAARQAIGEYREAWLAGEPRLTGGIEAVESRARELVEAMQRPSLRRVINATGVIVHTNLGRAPLPLSAREAVARAAAGYSNLELDLERGARGSRHAHVEALLRELTGAEAAIAVNNGAAAVLLAVAALAGSGRAVIVSRGQLVEIGGGFRIPEVVGESGAELVEVGTTNRTRLRDYERALSSRPDAAVLRVHQSNFRAIGFVEETMDRGAVRTRGAGDRRRRVGCAGRRRGDPRARRGAVDRALSGGRRGARVLLGRQAARRPPGRPDRGPARPPSRRRANTRWRGRCGSTSCRSRRSRRRFACLVDPEGARREIPVLAMLDASTGVLAERARRLAGGEWVVRDGRRSGRRRSAGGRCHCWRSKDRRWRVDSDVEPGRARQRAARV